MVKGVTRQVIVMQSPDPQLFDQAIFILKDEALGEGVTDEQLLREAQQVIRGVPGKGKKARLFHGALYAAAGAAATGAVWLVTGLI